MSRGTIMLSAGWMFAQWMLLGVCFLCASASLACFLLVRQISLDLANARRLAGTIGELSEDLDALSKSVSRLHSRAGMREVRERRGSPGEPARSKDGCPDWNTDPKGWIVWQEQEIARQRRIT